MRDGVWRGISPARQGGSNSKDNLVVACQHCNRSKNDTLPEDFINSLS
ncbi:MAG: HNH endonuclease [Deltaproteobacteria bacterium]|nr:HNH endonuclease [Deltaproteobacteria bacterium]